MSLNNSNTYEGGTNTTAISNANSGGSSGTAFSSILGTAPTFSTTHPATGSLGARFTGSAQMALVWTFTSEPTIINSSNIYFTGFTNSPVIFRARITSTQVIRLAVNTSGNLIIRDSTNAQIGSASTNAFTNNSQNAFRVTVTPGGTTSSGSGKVEIWCGTTLTGSPTETINFSSQNLGAGSGVDEVNFGLAIAPAGAINDYYLDDTKSYTGISVTVNQATETDTANPVGKTKKKLLGQALETDTANQIRPSRSKNVGQAVETDTATVVGHKKAFNVGQALETDTAQPLVIPAFVAPIFTPNHLGPTLPPATPSLGVPPDEVIEALLAGVVEIIRHIEIYESDAVTPFDIDNWDRRLVDGSISIDGSRDERRMGDFTLDNTDFALNLNPVNGFWYDKIIKAFWGINYYTSSGAAAQWLMQVGEFMIDRIDEDYFPDTVRITCRDWTKKCLVSDIVNSLQFDNQTPVETIIAALAANAGIFKFRMPYTGLTFQDDVVFDAGSSRWTLMVTLAASVGYEVYFTADGYLTMRPYQDPVTSPTVWTYDTSADRGSLVSVARSSSDAGVKNHCVVMGAAQTSDLGFTFIPFGEVRNDDPTSPTYIGRIGDRVDFFKADYITTTEQAQALAETRYRISALEEYDVSFESLILPWLDAYDIVIIDNPKESNFVPARYLFTNYTLPMGLGTQSGTAKRVTIVGTTRNFEEQ